MKKILIILLLPIVIAIFIIAFQFAFINTAYTNVECGTQKSYLRVLWRNFDEPPIDEYGIEVRWTEAHERKCNDKWEAIALGAAESSYWPELHLMIAKGISVDLIREKIKVTSPSEVGKKDALGRTVLHWLAIHPDYEESSKLASELLKGGLAKISKDSNGLYPNDWKNNMKAKSNKKDRDTQVK